MVCGWQARSRKADIRSALRSEVTVPRTRNSSRLPFPRICRRIKATVRNILFEEISRAWANHWQTRAYWLHRRHLVYTNALCINNFVISKFDLYYPRTERYVMCVKITQSQILAFQMILNHSTARRDLTLVNKYNILCQINQNEEQKDIFRSCNIDKSVIWRRKKMEYVLKWNRDKEASPVKDQQSQPNDAGDKILKTICRTTLTRRKVQHHEYNISQLGSFTRLAKCWSEIKDCHNFRHVGFAFNSLRNACTVEIYSPECFAEGHTNVALVIAGKEFDFFDADDHLVTMDPRHDFSPNFVLPAHPTQWETGRRRWLNCYLLRQIDALKAIDNLRNYFQDNDDRLEHLPSIGKTEHSILKNQSVGSNRNWVVLKAYLVFQWEHLFRGWIWNQLLKNVERGN